MLNARLSIRVPVANYPLAVPVPMPAQPRRFSTDIITEVAERWRVGPDEIKGPRRLKRISRARQEALYLMRRHTRLSLPHIGQILGGRDHTTVLHGIRVHCRRNGLRVPARAELVG